MCGRYFFDMEKTFQDHHELKKRIEQMKLSDFQLGEVFPSQQALVLVQVHQEVLPAVKKWGIQGFKGNLLINARSEGIAQKVTFHPMLKNRCVVLANGFYEWVGSGKKKDKIAITKMGQSLLYLAAIYNRDNQFVIVTGEAQGAMHDIHNRTPIIMNEIEMRAYLQNKHDFIVDNEALLFEKNKEKLEDNNMRYAITYENKQVFQHFGKCPSFLLVDMQDTTIIKQEIKAANGAGHGALAQWLVQEGVDTLVCGGIGQGARDALQVAKIQLISGAKGHIDIILNKLTKQTLKDDPSGRCTHHHEGEEHDCGSHDCGGHT